MRRKPRIEENTRAVVAIAITALALSAPAGGSGEGNRDRSARCGPTATVQPPSAYRRGVVRVRNLEFGGFGEERAHIAVERGSQAVLTVRATAPYASPIVLRGVRCRDGKSLGLFLVSGGDRFPPIPAPPLPGRGKRSVTLTPPRTHFALYVFVSSSGRWKVSVWQARKRVGAIVFRAHVYP